MYGAAAEVTVHDLEPPKRIRIEWGGGGRFTTVEWYFDARPGDTTLVRVSNSGFEGDDAALLAQALDSMGGFTSLLAGARAYLEHDLQLNLVADHHPDAHIKKS